jgi:ATP-dependent DNA helicase RecQ
MTIGPTEINQCLRRYFGFQSFRPGQRELIEAVLAGKDALGILPTGGGKSLTYQLPAVLLPGLMIVVSPLIALIKDQVDAFNRRGDKQAVAIHSNMSISQAREAMAQAIKGNACMMFWRCGRKDIFNHLPINTNVLNYRIRVKRLLIKWPTSLN